MEIIEPHLPRVVPLFRALHTYHAELAPSVYHCDGTDAEYMTVLEEKCRAGGRVFAHEAAWGLVSYVLVWPDIVERDALRCGTRTLRVDHLYIAPTARGMGLGKELIARVEDCARDLGLDGWNVSYHANNPGAAEFYAAMKAKPKINVCLRAFGQSET